MDVALSELNALSECHPLSETSTRLADMRNLEGNLSYRHALIASSACSASRLSPSRLSASLVLSENSLTHAKRDIEVSEPFLSLICAE